MKKIFFFVLLLFCLQSNAQNDSNATTIKKPLKDTLKKNIVVRIINSLEQLDSLLTKDSTSLTTKINDSSSYDLLYNHPLLNKNIVEYQISKTKPIDSKDSLFYVITGCIFILGITKSLFRKNFNNIFNIFFQTNFRQKQTKEQLLQDSFATILLNAVFVCTVSIFITLALPLYNNISLSFWKLLIASLLIVTIIYSVKYVFINFLGWAFNFKEATNAYLFIIFIINKIIGVVLAPAIVLIAFSSKAIASNVFVITTIILGLILVYRVILSYKSAVSRLKINLLHFFLYFCSIEILPLLILYKCIKEYL